MNSLLIEERFDDIHGALLPEGAATILIVDDRPANLGFVVDSLEQQGYRVIVAQDGDECLQRVDFARPDLILLDVMMPGMDGFEVCRRLKSMAGCQDIPVVFMTALAETETKLSAFTLGAVDYVTKPLQVDEVIARIGAHLRVRGVQQALHSQAVALQHAQAGLQDELAERQAAERALVALHATRDALTGLPNRMHFQEHLERAMVHAERAGRGVGVLLLDLDNFRDVNEALGHASGDKLLKSTAALLCGALDGAGQVARVGGDKFAILAAQAGDAAGLAVLAQRLLRMVARPRLVDGHEILVDCSIGSALFPVDGMCADTLLSNADSAMLRAKAEGRSLYRHYTADLNQSMRRRLELGSAMRHAIREGEFLLLYQPRIDLRSGRAVGMEALLRWNSAQLGSVAPDEFIPVAEHNGMILPLGDWVLYQACHQARQWYDSMPAPIPVAVNLSARQFRDADLVTIIAGALEASGLPAELLELELTETMVMHDANSAMHTLAALKKLGVRLAIDDFGTGYSSLSYLKSFPLDYLKIDRSFVRDLASDRNDAAIVCAIIAMAHTLGLKVIAEGVETHAQLAFLREQGCDEIQGYVYSKPLSAADMGCRLALPAPARAAPDLAWRP